MRLKPAVVACGTFLALMATQDIFSNSILFTVELISHAEYAASQF
jgi:hypothetical protein